MYDKSYFENYAKAPEDWRRGYELRRYTYDAVARLLNRHQPDSDSMAEFGCGLGMLSFHMLQRKPSLKIEAFDISRYAVDIAAERLAGYPQVSVRMGDAQAADLPSAAFDVVVSVDVVEHLPQPERLFEEAFRVLRSGGLLYFSTPNPASLGARLKRPRSLGAVNSRPSDRWFADRDDTHINIRPRSAWRSLCSDTGFIVVREGTDSLWDTPYFPDWPVLPQKLIGNGSQRLLVPLFGMLPWSLGETHIGLWRKP